MRSSKIAAIAALGCLGVLGATVMLFRSSPSPSTTLIADSAVPVYDVAVVDPAGRRVIGAIDIGEAVAVTGCVDLKHYLAPEVLLRDGRKGYVIEGRFHLQSKSSASGLGACP